MTKNKVHFDFDLRCFTLMKIRQIKEISLKNKNAFNSDDKATPCRPSYQQTETLIATTNHY